MKTWIDLNNGNFMLVAGEAGEVAERINHARAIDDGFTPRLLQFEHVVTHLNRQPIWIDPAAVDAVRPMS